MECLGARSAMLLSWEGLGVGAPGNRGNRFGNRSKPIFEKRGDRRAREVGRGTYNMMSPYEARATNTGQGACRTTFSAVLPSSARFNPV